MIDIMGDKGRAHRQADRATHESSQSSLSRPEVGIPCALLDALGGVVSRIADARDTYPDDATTLQAVTEEVHEIYACALDGVFGPIDYPLADEAFSEALRRYPDAHGALVFLWGASGLGFREPNAEQLEWARGKAQAIEARRAIDSEAGVVEDESAVANGDASKG